MQELLKIFCQKPIDFEFAIVNEDKKEQLFLLQARPLILQEEPISSEKLKSFLSVIEKKMQRDATKTLSSWSKNCIWCYA